MATWSNRYARGTPAVTRRRIGDGSMLYVGTYLTDELLQAIAADTLVHAGIRPLVPDLPAGVEVTLREGTGRRLLFVINTVDQETIVRVPPGRSLLGPQLDGALLTLGAYDYAVIELDTPEFH